MPSHLISAVMEHHRNKLTPVEMDELLLDDSTYVVWCHSYIDGFEDMLVNVFSLKMNAYMLEIFTLLHFVNTRYASLYLVCFCHVCTMYVLCIMTVHFTK